MNAIYEYALDFHELSSIPKVCGPQLISIQEICLLTRQALMMRFRAALTVALSNDDLKSRARQSGQAEFWGDVMNEQSLCARFDIHPVTYPGQETDSVRFAQAFSD